MKKPEKVLSDLSEKSMSEGMPLSEWVDYLYDLRDELQIMTENAVRDLEDRTE